MKFRKVAVLTHPESWFIPYAEDLVRSLKFMGLRSKLFLNHNYLHDRYDIAYILSYFKIIEKRFLARHRHNIVVHESKLPEGKGWAPLFWQILEGKNKIPIVLFEATEEIDSGRTYIKDFIRYKGHELHDEIRHRQAEKTIEMCLKFITDYDKLKARPQRGKVSFYRRRTPLDSKLNIDEPIKKQFNLLRIVDNERFPAFFDYKGHRYILKIHQAKIRKD